MKRGGRLIVPPATPFNEPKLLDSLNVQAVLRALPYTHTPLDLGALTGSPAQPGGVARIILLLW